MRQRDPAEMNITAFMNLMVVLVPFLLITAVFSRLAVVQLNLPAPDTESVPEQNERDSLSVIVRLDRIQVAVNGSVLQSFEPGPDGYNYQALNELIVTLRDRIASEVTSATVLLEPDVEYDLLIQVMDSIRMSWPTEDAVSTADRRQLFPNIAIGDAPPRATESNG
ncbi:biopolymer transporter ExbD [uncultured Abyssibacter sp.]|uniref:ExbD/TolR family protein n=1 Tax=uncultured Abyssibacter sp. TaxID=2320202 RepID=UPI0032B15DEF